MSFGGFLVFLQLKKILEFSGSTANHANAKCKSFTGFSATIVADNRSIYWTLVQSAPLFPVLSTVSSDFTESKAILQIEIWKAIYSFTFFSRHRSMRQRFRLCTYWWKQVPIFHWTDRESWTAAAPASSDMQTHFIMAMFKNIRRLRILGSPRSSVRRSQWKYLCRFDIVSRFSHGKYVGSQCPVACGSMGQRGCLKNCSQNFPPKFL